MLGRQLEDETHHAGQREPQTSWQAETSSMSTMSSTAWGWAAHKSFRKATREIKAGRLGRFDIDQESDISGQAVVSSSCHHPSESGEHKWVSNSNLKSAKSRIEHQQPAQS
jgi:hypothetical protein